MIIKRDSREDEGGCRLQARVDPEGLVNEHEAANFLALSVGTLRNWRVSGLGPVFIKISKKAVRYRRRDLIGWVDARCVSSTSEFDSKNAAGALLLYTEV